MSKQTKVEFEVDRDEVVLKLELRFGLQEFLSIARKVYVYAYGFQKPENIIAPQIEHDDNV